MSHRSPLLQLLGGYTAWDAQEQQYLRQTIDFVRENEDCFERSLEPGHMTSSAWILSPDRQQVLLLFHTKLGKWLQPGGHADGDPDLLEVALREVKEETGLQELRTLNAGIFDLDIHTIPARKSDPEHLHYDLRFLLEASPDAPLFQNHESRALRWVPLTEVNGLTQERSVLRMVEKSLA